MSQNNDKAKRERSMKLCQLVRERQIDSEVGYEIRKLFEEGVLIDFQDQNRNQKTAIHSAIDKGDITCVNFLLQFKPSLEVVDEDGRTPIELAELNGFDDILNVLLNSSVDVVNESYVEVFDYESITREKIEAVKLRPTFKVMKLINCPSVDEVWVKLKVQGHTKTFNESSHLFFIAIEINETKIDNDLELMKKVLIVRRPMIVQLTSSNSQNAKIYFKDDKKEFVEITDTTQLTQEEFDVAINSQQSCNMKLLVAALRSNLFGHFTGNLLDTKLNTENRIEAVNQFARSNALCHRFFKLFDGNQPQIETIVAALSYKGDQSLLALLDLPVELNDGKLKLTEYQQDILRVVDSNDCNLLIMGAEQNNLDAVKLLLRCDCDFNHADYGENRAVDICWEVKAYDCLAELIEAGSPYPLNFSKDELEESAEAFKRIDAMIEAVNSFHANIEDGEVEEVKKFITGHPHIKHAYDAKNKSALTVALQSKEVEIYSLLMSEGFEPGADDEYQNACLKSRLKNEIRDSHRKYFKKASNEPHVKRLVEKSKLSFGSKDRAKCSTIIRKMFYELNKIDELIPILQICSTSDKLKIVFDFNCDSVVAMDVTKEPNSLGAVYPSDGFVYIGAKNHRTEFYEVIGTLIHELTHYAMKLTYENSCKPYEENDNEKSKQFENVAIETKKICDENLSTDSIVTTVFSLYSESVWHQELIVRVPQLLAHYKNNPKALEAAERNTAELFHFYREKTLKDVAAKSEVLLQKYLISKINKQTGIARKIENLNVKFENVEIDLKPVNLITSNAPQLTLAMLRQFDCDNCHIFVTLEQVEIGNVLDKIAKINANQIPTILIVDCYQQVQTYHEKVRTLLKKVKSIEIVALVMTEDESLTVKGNFTNVEIKILSHKWADLTENTKIHLLDQNVIFHGIETKLNELVKPSSEAMNFFPLNNILDCKEFKIGSPLQKSSHNFYVGRKFTRKGPGYPETTKIKELIQCAEKRGAVVISDEAGSGKSVALFEIAKRLHDSFPDRWIQFVDLKRHIEAFKSVEDYKKIKIFPDFFLEQIQNDETEFDRELFKQMFRAGKTFVLFDGFDEISPNYKDLLLHVLKLFDRQSGNQLYITTRPHLEADLKDALGHFVFKLEAFSEEMKINFLVDYWKSVGFEIREEFSVLSDRLLKKFSEISRSNFIGLPLLLCMTAQIFSDPTKGNLLDNVESLNVASIFKEFVDKYLARWKQSGNDISLRENVEIDRDGGILEIHHIIALKHKFGDKFPVFEVDESDAEKIARVGLVRYDKTEKTFQFIHETFAEYFVADFIWFHLKRKNRNPSHDCRMAIEALIKVLSYNFEVIHRFLDQILETAKFILSDASCQSLGKCFSEVLTSRSWCGILPIGLSEVVENQNWCDILSCSFYLRDGEYYDEKILFLLLSIVNYADGDVLLKMLKYDKYNGSEALSNVAIRSTSKIVSTLCNIIATRVENSKEMFTHKTGSWPNILFLAALNKNEGVMTSLCESLKTVLTRDEIGTMFQCENETSRRERSNVLCLATNRSSSEVLNEIISLLLYYVPADGLKKLLMSVDCFEQNCFQRAVGQYSEEENVKMLIDFAKKLLDTKELEIFFNRTRTWDQKNIFHLAAQNVNIKILSTIIESTCDVFSSDDIFFMLLQRDSEESSVFHIIAENVNNISWIELNSVLQRHLSVDDLKILLLQRNEEGYHCFHLVLLAEDYELQNCFQYSVGSESISKIDEIESLSNLVKSILNQDDQKAFYGAKNLFHLAIENRNKEIFSAIHGCLKGVFTDIEIKSMVQEKDSNGNNILLSICQCKSFHNSEKLPDLLKLLKNTLDANELKKFLSSSNSHGSNCLLVTVKFEHSRFLKILFEFIQTELRINDQRNMIQERDIDENNIFMCATLNHDAEIFLLVKGYAKDILTKDQFSMLIEKFEFDDDEGSSRCETDEDL